MITPTRDITQDPMLVTKARTLISNMETELKSWERVPPGKTHALRKIKFWQSSMAIFEHHRGGGLYAPAKAKIDEAMTHVTKSIPLAQAAAQSCIDKMKTLNNMKVQEQGKPTGTYTGFLA